MANNDNDNDNDIDCLVKLAIKQYLLLNEFNVLTKNKLIPTQLKKYINNQLSNHEFVFELFYGLIQYTTLVNILNIGKELMSTIEFTKFTEILQEQRRIQEQEQEQNA